MACDVAAMVKNDYRCRHRKDVTQKMSPLSLKAAEVIYVDGRSLLLRVHIMERVLRSASRSHSAHGFSLTAPFLAVIPAFFASPRCGRP